MKKKIFAFLLILILGFAFAHGGLEASLPVFDAVNAALGELRNALIKNQFTQEIVLALERLNQLKAQYLEIVRFHSGMDEIFRTLVGDPLRDLASLTRGSLRDTFMDFGWITRELEYLTQASGPRDIRAALERLTGDIPVSDARPYIPFEEAQVVSGFELAQKIRDAGRRTRDAARLISDQARTASPKGAVRLQAEALSQVMVLNQQNQEALAKLLELEATRIEQVSRDEKRIEKERQKWTQDARVYLNSVLRGGGF